MSDLRTTPVVAVWVKPIKRCVGAAINQLGGGLPRAGEMQLILDDLEKARGVFETRLVIRRQRENLAYAQIHALFAGTDVADALQQFIEIIGRGDRADGRVFQAFVVNRKTLLQILAQRARRPLAELRAARGTDAVADGDNHRQGVVFELPPHFALALGLNL